MTITAIILAAAKSVGISGTLLLAICTHESNLKNITVQDDGGSPSYGVCQVKLETAQYMDNVYGHKIKANEGRLKNNYVNAFYAAEILKFQLKRYDNNLNMAIDAYNKGTAISESSVYVKRVMALLEE